MACIGQADRRTPTRLAAGGALAVAATVALAACGGGPSRPMPTSSSPASSPHAAAAAAYTVKLGTAQGVGDVLVNGQGRTLYLLTSEKGGKLTCTDATGCTKVWPDTELPKGISHGIAGTGIEASLLRTVRSTDGSLYLVYGSSRWPLYTYSGDSGPGQANGRGIVSFGGTWWPISAAGTPVTSTTQTAPATTGGGGY